MKRLTIVIAILNLVFIVKAQKVDPKHTNYYKYKDVMGISTDEYTMDFSDIVARTTFCKLAVKITNKTSDFLIFERDRSEFEFEFGRFPNIGKEVLIKPNSSKKKVLEVSGGEKFHQDQFELSVKGLYRVPLLGKAITISNMVDFQVPASKNSVSSDLFTVVLLKSSLKTKESELTFECVYNGNEVGIVDPANLVIKVDGTEKEYANDHRKGGPKLLKKGEKVKFKAIFHIPGKVADMQFANMTILWKNSFIESKRIKLEDQQIGFEVDRGMTAGKN